MNTNVNFEIAKLLKEKGYDQYSTLNGFKINGEESFDYTLDRINGVGVAAPTIAEVIMWLYENHNIWIYVDSHEFGKWCYNHKYNRPHELSPRITENGQFGLDDYNSPIEAYEAGILYALNNLI